MGHSGGVKEREAIVGAWTKARSAGRQGVLATVVRVEGSAYRGVGARMLVLDAGERVGGISGGCLEDEVAKKAFWLTEGGSAVERFSTRTEDNTRPYGMGCEGVVHLLLERLRPDQPNEALELLAACRTTGAPGVLASVVATSDAVHIGEHVALWPDGRLSGRIGDDALTTCIGDTARRCLQAGSDEQALEHRGGRIEIVFERIDPPPALVLFGAGDDAIPVVAIAKELGWHVTVADGRAHYATPARFPRADRVLVTRLEAPLAALQLSHHTACVVMSHSFEQDRAALEALAPKPIAYLGLLGPLVRTRTLLDEIGSPHFACPTGLHNPVGLDIGSGSPESIALAIIAEIQAVLTGRDGRPLRNRANDTPEERTPHAEVER